MDRVHGARRTVLAREGEREGGTMTTAETMAERVRPTLADLADDPILVEGIVLDLWMRAGPAAVGAGREWYRAANAVITSMAREAGLPVLTVAAIVAVLSPMCRWAGNIEDAVAVLDGRRTSHGLPASEQKALRILAGEDIESVLGNGPKVRSFLDDLMLGATSYGFGVTSDTWMVRALTGDPFGDYKLGANGGGGMTLRRYREIARHIVAACEKIGLTAREWQATVWIEVRGAEG